jgi:hypothetical protein
VLEHVAGAEMGMLCRDDRKQAFPERPSKRQLTTNVDQSSPVQADGRTLWVSGLRLNLTGSRDFHIERMGAPWRSRLQSSYYFLVFS